MRLVVAIGCVRCFDSKAFPADVHLQRGLHLRVENTLGQSDEKAGLTDTAITQQDSFECHVSLSLLQHGGMRRNLLQFLVGEVRRGGDGQRLIPHLIDDIFFRGRH